MTDVLMREVKAVFYVDGVERMIVVQQVPDFAIQHVIASAYIQIDDPDVDGAIEIAKFHGEPLPTGY